MPTSPLDAGRRRLLLCGAALVAAGCDRPDRSARVIDVEWHRQAMLGGHLQHWLKVAPGEGGAFRGRFARDWQPLDNRFVDLTLQGRLTYAMAIGHEVSGDARYLDAARRGGEFLLQRFKDPVHGGFFAVLTPDGAVAVDAKRAYGNAFALFALAHLHRVTHDPVFADGALQAWQALRIGLIDPQGGLYGEAARDFKPPAAGARSQNPVMHMFEALLALVEAGGGEPARAGARQLGDFVAYRLLQGLPDGEACIPEWYDAAWKPLPTQKAGGYVDLGHQFEWFHLLRLGGELGVSPIYAPLSERVLLYALKRGYDEAEGGCFSQVFPEGSVNRDKGWWQQGECVRALVRSASGSGRSDLWRRYEQTLGLIRSQWIDPDHGGWFTTPCRGGGCGNEQPDPYHMVAMHREALLAARAN